MKRSKGYSGFHWWPAASLPYLQVSISFPLTFRITWRPCPQTCSILRAFLLLLSLKVKVVDHLKEAQVSRLVLRGFLYPLTRLQHPSRLAWYLSYASSSNMEYTPHSVADLLLWPLSIQGNLVCACILCIKYKECSLAYLEGRWAWLPAVHVIDWHHFPSELATSASLLLRNTNRHSGCPAGHRESPSYAWPSSCSTSCSHLGTCSKWWVLFESAVPLALLGGRATVLDAVDDHWQGHLADLPCFNYLYYYKYIKTIKDM